MKFFLKSFPYINEPTRYNLEKETPDKYFVLNKGRQMLEEDILKQASRI